MTQQNEGRPTSTMWLGFFFWFSALWILIAGYTLPVVSSLMTWTWQVTSCTIDSAGTRSSVSRVRGHNVETIHAAVSYRYVVRGREYSSTQYNLNDGVVDGVSQRVARLKVGASVACYYDPDDPSHAILDREGVSGSVWAFLIQMFLTVGISVFIDGLKGLEKDKPRPYLRGIFWTMLAVTFAASLVGFGLSLFAGAPVAAWLLSCILPFLLYWGYQWIEDHRRA